MKPRYHMLREYCLKRLWGWDLLSLCQADTSSVKEVLKTQEYQTKTFSLT